MRFNRGDRVRWPNTRDGHTQYGVVMGPTKKDAYTEAYGHCTTVYPTAKPDEDVQDLPGNRSGLGVMVCTKDLVLVTRRGDPASPHAWPRFKHDCERCHFMGHFAGHDIYRHDGKPPTGASLLARYGNEGSEYYSTTEPLFKDAIVRNFRVQMGMTHPPVIREGVLEPYQLAWLTALALERLKRPS